LFLFLNFRWFVFIRSISLIYYFSLFLVVGFFLFFCFAWFSLVSFHSFFLSFSHSHSFSLSLGGVNSHSNARSASVLHLVDLAGSERLAVSRAEGQRLKETQAREKRCDLVLVFVNMNRIQFF
jgi:hypothetical protein